ncbi:hypothetical protein [Vogesella alkaliphila]|uniref:hypothetical protein n=1 Tax=Vogesella alkaliphila TaxID=1193621 RepID=UPI0016743273|nr:hypothetical protein [Vogesella alkaliphila]
MSAAIRRTVGLDGGCAPSCLLNLGSKANYQQFHTREVFNKYPDHIENRRLAKKKKHATKTKARKNKESFSRSSNGKNKDFIKQASY